MISPQFSTPPAVQVAALHRSFEGRQILDGVDLHIAQGEFVAMLGASGSGKSTLLRVLAGLDDGATGTVSVPRRRAVMYQDARLLPWHHVLDNLRLGLTTSQAEALSLLGEVGLEARFARKWPNTLSGGEAQRVALARALLRRPDFLLLDEPFGALDALTRIRMQNLLADLHRKHRCAVLLVTHDVEEALLLADRVVVLKGGRFITDIQIDMARPRPRTAPALLALRSRLLVDLGVEDAPTPDETHSP